MDANGTNLTMIRGDSERIIVECGSGMAFPTGSELRMTVRRNDLCSNKIFEKVVTSFPNNTAIFDIAPADTNGVKCGKHIYDMRLTEPNGTVTTVIKPSAFIILKEVSYV